MTAVPVLFSTEIPDSANTEGRNLTWGRNWVKSGDVVLSQIINLLRLIYDK